MTVCKKIEPFVLYYNRLINSYNNNTHNILKNVINLILPQIPISLITPSKLREILNNVKSVIRKTNPD